MNRFNRSILVGMVLGDGYIRTQSAADDAAGRRISPQLTCAHGGDQKEYAQHKLDVLRKMFNSKATLRTRQNGVSTKGKPLTAHYFAVSNPYLRVLKGMMYRDGTLVMTRQILDMLSPRGIAYWFMDDGSTLVKKRDDGTICGVSLRLHICRTDIDETMTVVKYFKETWNINCKLMKEKGKHGPLYSIRMNTSEAKKFGALIIDFVIPSMMYKLSTLSPTYSHERTTPHKRCNECKRMFNHLSGGLCKSCENEAGTMGRAAQVAECSECKRTKSRKWYVGTRCRPCYEKSRRSV